MFATQMKLSSVQASVSGIAGFGFPRWTAKAGAVGIPLSELFIAVALLFSSSARWGAVGALVLLCLFSAVVTNALRQGLAPACNCFGQISSEPISGRTLLRNAALSAVAVFVIIEGPGSALTSWTSNTQAANLVAALACLAAAVLAVVAWAHRGGSAAAAAVVARSARASALGRPAAGSAPGTPAIGTPAPDFELPSIAGQRTSLRELLARGRPVVLVFASPGCGPCIQLLPQLARWNTAIGDDLTLVVIESGIPDGALPEEQRAALEGTLALSEPGRELATRYGAQGTPCGIWVDAEGRIASRPMPGTGSVEQLIRRVLASSTPPAAAAAPGREAVHDKRPALAHEEAVLARHEAVLAPETVPPRHALSGEISGEIFGVGVTIGADQPRVLELMADWLPSAWHEGRPRVEPVSFTIRAVDNSEHELWRGELLVHRGQLDEVLASFEMQLRTHVAQNAPEHVFVHAGTVAVDNRAIVIPGESFSGKTTLVRALIKAGALYFSDEYAVFDQNGLIHPYLKPLAVRDGSNGFRGKSFHAARTLGALSGEQPVRLGVVLCTRYSRGGVWQPAELSAGQALLELIPHTFRAPERAAETLATLGRAFDASVIGLQGERGDASELVPQILAVLEGRREDGGAAGAGAGQRASTRPAADTPLV